MQAVTKISVTT